MKTALVALIIALAIAAPAHPAPQPQEEYRDVVPGRGLKFPAAFYYDAGYRVQWWYFTGHLADGSGREFGYELTFFIVGVQKRPYVSKFGVNNIYISHFAVSDLKNKKFLFADRADAGAYGAAGARADTLAVWVGPNRLEGTPERMRITAADEKHALELTLTPTKPPVLHGEKGYSRKSALSPFIASYYFSYPRLAAEGTLRVGRQTFRVSGTSWFDRELSSRGLGAGQTGWDWFSLQLDDGRDLMLYLIRNKDGSADPYSSGTLVYPGGGSLFLTKSDFTVTALRRYSSKKTGARYPAQWEISVPSAGLNLKVTPLIEDQEALAQATTRNYYWEGACRVEGTVTGKAYVELVGY